MWVYSRQRNEQDKRTLFNLDHYATLSVSQLGNRWFVDIATGSESQPLASVETQEEANAVLQAIFESLQAGDTALDLNPAPEEKEDRPSDPANRAEGDSRKPQEAKNSAAPDKVARG